MLMRIRIHFKWMVGGSIDEWPSYVVPCSILGRRRCYQKITIDLPFCQRRRSLRFSFVKQQQKKKKKKWMVERNVIGTFGLLIQTFRVTKYSHPPLQFTVFFDNSLDGGSTLVNSTSFSLTMSISQQEQKKIGLQTVNVDYPIIYFGNRNRCHSNMCCDV